MAKLRHGIFGPFSGKIGSIVGASWKNINYMRSLPVKKKNGTPRTVAQIAASEKFKFLQQLLVPFHPYVTVGFQNLAKDKTEINAAFSANYKNAVTGVYPHLGVDYSQLLLSKGDLQGLDDVALSLSAPDTVSLTWDTNHTGNGNYNDQLMLVLYDPELKIADGFIGGIKRNAGHCSYQFSPKLQHAAFEVYLGLVSLNGKKVADSQYLGRVTP